MAKRVMVVMGLLSFVITVIGGLIHRNTFEFTLTRALWAMLGFCLLGMLIGWAAERVVREHRSKQYEQVFGYPKDNPPPEENEGESAE